MAATEDIVAVADSILQSPEGSEFGGDVTMAESTVPRDVAGPSTTFLPPSEHTHARPASPTLPDLTKRFPGADEDDEDDEIVARLPVYLSPALHPSLSVFQFPLQHRSLRVPGWAADRGKRITSRVKENVGRVEIEIPVDADPKVWREERAKDLNYVPDASHRENGHARDVGVEGGYPGRDRERAEAERKKRAKEPKWGDKMRLRSEAVPMPANQYFSGIVHEGALHLHPLSRVLQFRTAMGYLDDFDVRNRSTTRREEEEEKKKAAAKKDQPRPMDDPNNDGSGSIKDFRNKMWSTAQREDEDKWVSYEWNEGAEDQRVVDSLEHLLLPEDRREMLECKSRGLDWLDRDQR